MKSYRIVEATQEYVDALKGRLRPGDLAEIAAASGREPDIVLQRAWDISELRWAGLAGGQVVTLFGAARLTTLSTVGIPWMLGAKELAGEGLSVGRESRHYLRVMRSQFSRLENMIDARQKRSVRWLRWMGFTVESALPWGVSGLPFHRFWIGGSHV